MYETLYFNLLSLFEFQDLNGNYTKTKFKITESSFNATMTFSHFTSVL